MSDRHVSFQLSNPAKSSSRSYRSREPGHDSGLGSSSSEQASLGGRPDRRFTAEDYHDQLYSVGALQEALGQANKKVEHCQKKCADLDNELTRSHRNLRDTERLYREECEKNERLEKVNKELEDDKSALQIQIKELRIDYDQLKDECDDYRHRYRAITDSPIDDTMSGANGEPLSRVRRSGSRHDKSRRESKGTSRRHAESSEERPGPSRRRNSISVNPGAHLSSSRAYVEKMPSPQRHSGNYTVDLASGPMDPYSNVPRTPRSAAQSGYHSASDAPPTGNYIQYPIQYPTYERGHRRI
ncbi:uncharacterized protein F4822DRAFT_429622 [Hypoxylon trugodes]|uniref:uncharacterized protein n=1 Tax=Hypoxylon trugodes TaxID=326681 RepID=UPI00218FAAF2|nr:uncharacterized protein F4822DRAFT_429622 [Hypoxylon trugodes]KAI1389008.1 hypothetical protein F4822DRAFT_429622 [Hypoxylon trugodes]